MNINVICHGPHSNFSFSKKDMDTAFSLVSNWYGTLRPVIGSGRSVKIKEILIEPSFIDAFNMGMKVIIKISTNFGEIEVERSFPNVIANKRQFLKQLELNKKLNEVLFEALDRFKNRMEEQIEHLCNISSALNPH